MNNDPSSLAAVSLLVTAAMTYARFASSRLHPGLPRLAALIPVLVLLPFLPFSFSSVVLRGNAAFFLVWLGASKLLLLAFGRGPLHPSLPLLPFVFSSSLPVKLRSPNPDLKPTSQSPLHLIPPTTKAVLLAVLVYLYRFKNDMNPYLLLTLYCIHIYLFLDLVLSLVAAVGRALGMEMEPQFDKPYLATSLRDFWGRRWNLMVSAILRPSVYDPVRARLGAPAGVMAAFVLSGLMHEVMFYYNTFRGPTGEVTAFFVLHGGCTVAEGWWARQKGWWRPPRAVATPLVLGFVAVTGFWLFFPGLVGGGMDEKLLAEWMAATAFLEDAGRKLVGSSGLVVDSSKAHG